MGSQEALFAAIEADPRPLVEAALDRLIEERGQPSLDNGVDVRFGRKGSLWVNRVTGAWRDWEAGVGGLSWLLAQIVDLTNSEIAALYGMAPDDSALDAKQLARLRRQAEKRKRDRIVAEGLQRQCRRQAAERIFNEATVATPRDPAGRYMTGRGFSSMSGVWFHEGPTITTRDGQAMHLAPCAVFPVTDRQGDLCAVHCVQLDVETSERLRHFTAKISVGSLIEGYVRFGESGDVVAIGEGAETVRSVHQVVPSWRCVASCSSIRLIHDDTDLQSASHLVLLAERGMENTTRDLGATLAATYQNADVHLAFVPRAVRGEKADMNDALQVSEGFVRHALSKNQLEMISKAPA